MGKQIVLSALVSLFLLFAMVVTAIAQTRTAGVSVNDWFKYGNAAVYWSSNDPSATFPPPGYEALKEWNDTQWMRVDVTAISGTNITGQSITHYKNGTETTSGGWVDVDTGDGVNQTMAFISANLAAGDTIYNSGSYSTTRINETIPRTYAGGVRNTNHLNVSSIYIGDGAQISYSTNVYWDKSTGIIVEESIGESNQTGAYTTTWSAWMGITDSKVWVVPEFLTWTSTLLILIVVTPAVLAIYKRRLLKTPIH